VTDASELTAMAAAIDCTISIGAAEQLLAFLDAMLDENQRINLTAVREREAAVLFHALDSLAAGSAALGVEATSCLDLGTGNGFPGVAIACLFPEAEVTLMDRTLKKLEAIKRALAAAGFRSDRVRTVQMDAAEAPAHGHARRYDLVTARALGDPRVVGRLAQPLIRPGGSLLFWMSEEQRAKSTAIKVYQQPRYFDYALPAPACRVRSLARFER
jgi:16S rRNA (guanine527-N7)-methyltransferase